MLAMCPALGRVPVRPEGFKGAKEVSLHLRRQVCGPTQTDLAEFLRDIRAIPLLTPEEETQLASRYRRSGCAASRERLICSNLKLVVYIAKRYASLGVPIQDLVEAGNLGLLEAVERFDPGRGARFATYAVWWIRQSIGKTLLAQRRTIRIPSQLASTISEIASTPHDLTARMGRDPMPHEIARRMDLPLDRFQRVLALPRKLLPLDAPLGADEAGPVLAETVVPDEVVTPDQAMQRQSSLALAHLALAALSPEERGLLVLRFGIDGGRPRSVRSVAREYQVSRDTIRRLERRSLRKLSHDPDLRGLVED